MSLTRNLRKFKITSLNRFLQKNGFYIIVLFLLIILVILYYKQHKKSFVIPESNKTYKFKLQPNLFEDYRDIQLLFEPDDIKYYNETFVPLPEQIVFQPETPETNQPTVQIPEVDRQNVHDSYINKYIRKIYNDYIKVKCTPNIINEIKAHSGDNPKIIKVLNELTKRKAIITNLGDNSELDILATIWSKAKTNNNIKDMFLIQLSDSVDDDGNVVCPTGVVNRLTTSLIVETPEAFPKTKTMINDEILQTASKLRNELENDADYTELNEESQSIEFKNRLMERITNDYKGIIEVSELEQIVEPWIDSI